MAYSEKRSEGGHKSGHSNMAHRDYTSEVKKMARKVRRVQDKVEVDDDPV